jgi:hypothetical protein
MTWYRLLRHGSRAVLFVALVAACTPTPPAEPAVAGPEWRSDLEELRRISQGDRDYLVVVPAELPPHLNSVEHVGRIGESGTQLTYYHQGRLAVEFVTIRAGDDRYGNAACAGLQPPESTDPHDCLREERDLNGQDVLVYAAPEAEGETVQQQEIRAFWRNVPLVPQAAAEWTQ